jgi:hypothetical protein
VVIRNKSSRHSQSHGLNVGLFLPDAPFSFLFSRAPSLLPRFRMQQVLQLFRNHRLFEHWIPTDHLLYRFLVP